MQPEYLVRLSPDVATFVQEVEAAAGIEIAVVEDEKLNTGGPYGQGKLKVEAHTTPVRLLAPTNGYFPDGGVVHETLHVRRVRVEGVPLLAGADDCDPELERGLYALDNALEHLAIVPEELTRRPERLAHWESVMHRTWSQDLPGMAGHPAQRIWALMHWTFTREVLPSSEVANIARGFLARTGLQAEADTLADELLEVLTDKPTAVRLCLERFGLPRNMAVLEFVSSGTGARQEVV
jgi:hypothetical protein